MKENLQQFKNQFKNFITIIKNIFYQQNMVIFVGQKGITIGAYYRHNIINNIFIEHQNSDKNKLYKTFLKKYKNFQISFLLDCKECQLTHEFIPMFESLIKSNPVEKFIDENYKPQDIIAYNIYNIDRTTTTVYETTIASSPYTTDINEILEFLIYNSFKLDGVYFLSLEFESIIDKILETKNLEEHKDDFHILVTITKARDIRIAMKHQKNIMDTVTSEFPSDKSDMYIVGTIEQMITDSILRYRGYIKALNLKICLIAACDETLCELISESTTFKDYTIITYTSTIPEKNNTGANNKSKITTTNNAKNSNHFQDDLILELVTRTKQYPALNEVLRSIEKLTSINLIVFKPFIAVIIALILVLGAFKYREYVDKKETKNLNNKYYSLSEQYRAIKKRHPNVENITNLVDLYNFQNMLKANPYIPSEALEKIINIKIPNVQIDEVLWRIIESDSSKKSIILTINIKYKNSNKNIDLANSALNDYLKKIESSFPKDNVKYIKKPEDIMNINRELVVPANIIIKKNVWNNNQL